VCVVHVETAREMLAACESALPVNVAVCAAAVADWRPSEVSAHKRKKDGAGTPAITLVENPDILATLAAAGERRPRLVVGFAAETADLEANAKAKLVRKGCDWILANDVSTGSETFGGNTNTVALVTAGGIERWPTSSKAAIARHLVESIMAELQDRHD
jgi:phosphopantothenoylcysteine decarboxylase/phosphopantothenate--cysteine ligase